MFIGCSHSSSPPPVEDLTWKVPGTGSLYVDTYSRGTIALGQQGNSDASYSVKANGLFAGESNTVTLVNTRNSNDKEYLAFESNGDYSILDTSLGFSSNDWQRFPTGGGSPVLQSVDTLYFPDSIRFFDTLHVHKDFIRTYEGVENITDTSKVTYATFKIHQMTTEDDSVVSFQNPATPVITTLNTYYWIAPTIGWIVKDSSCDDTNWTRKVLDGCTVY